MRPHLSTENASVIEALQGLMDRLSDPDLTAAEARELHPRLFRLLETIEAEQYRKSATDDRKTACVPGRCMAV